MLLVIGIGFDESGIGKVHLDVEFRISVLYSRFGIVRRCYGIALRYYPGMVVITFSLRGF